VELHVEVGGGGEGVLEEAVVAQVGVGGRNWANGLKEGLVKTKYIQLIVSQIGFWFDYRIFSIKRAPFFEMPWSPCCF
jgi:hypothetical protein